MAGSSILLSKWSCVGANGAVPSANPVMRDEIRMREKEIPQKESYKLVL